MPKDVEELLAKASFLAKEENWDAAISAYTNLLALLEKYPHMLFIKPTVYIDRGKVYYRAGMHNHAIADFDQSLEISPNDAHAHIGRGIAYRRKDNRELAIADFDKALRLSPDNATAYNNRGAVYSASRKYTNALSDFNKALELSSDYVDAYSNRGNVYLAQSHYDSAISDYDAALKIDPKHIEAIHNRATAASAREHERQLEQLRADYKKNFLDTEEYKSRQKKYQQAADDVEKSIKTSFVFMQRAAAGVFALAVAAIALALFKKISVFAVIPLITAAGLCAIPFLWRIRTLKQDKARFIALSQDAYTKGILANLVGVNIAPEVQKELLRQFFDHHTQSGSAKLIIDLETGAKTESSGNVLVQNLKDHLPGKE